jgi:ribosomal protein L11 methylase PrmA
MTGLIVLFWILQLGFALLLFFLTIAFITGAPFVPTASNVSEKMIQMAEIKAGMTVIDLGSGDGRLLCLAVKKGARAIGYEINPFLVLYTKIKLFRTACSRRLKIYWRNFWSADVRNADVIFVYLLPWRMEKLKKKLLSQLKPGALVVSNSFIFRNWPIYKADRINHIYVFKIGENKS